MTSGNVGGGEVKRQVVGLTKEDENVRMRRSFHTIRDQQQEQKGIHTEERPQDGGRQGCRPPPQDRDTAGCPLETNLREVRKTIIPTSGETRTDFRGVKTNMRPSVEEEDAVAHVRLGGAGKKMVKKNAGDRKTKMSSSLEKKGVLAHSRHEGVGNAKMPSLVAKNMDASGGKTNIKSSIARKSAAQLLHEGGGKKILLSEEQRYAGGGETNMSSSDEKSQDVADALRRRGVGKTMTPSLEKKKDAKGGKTKMKSVEKKDSGANSIRTPFPASKISEFPVSAATTLTEADGSLSLLGRQRRKKQGKESLNPPPVFGTMTRRSTETSRAAVSNGERMDHKSSKPKIDNDEDMYSRLIAWKEKRRLGKEKVASRDVCGLAAAKKTIAAATATPATSSVTATVTSGERKASLSTKKKKKASVAGKRNNPNPTSPQATSTSSPAKAAADGPPAQSSLLHLPTPIPACASSRAERGFSWSREGSRAPSQQVEISDIVDDRLITKDFSRSKQGGGEAVTKATTRKIPAEERRRQQLSGGALTITGPRALTPFPNSVGRRKKSEFKREGEEGKTNYVVCASVTTTLSTNKSVQASSSQSDFTGVAAATTTPPPLRGGTGKASSDPGPPVVGARAYTRRRVLTSSTGPAAALSPAMVSSSPSSPDAAFSTSLSMTESNDGSGKEIATDANESESKLMSTTKKTAEITRGALHEDSLQRSRFFARTKSCDDVGGLATKTANCCSASVASTPRTLFPKSSDDSLPLDRRGDGMEIRNREGKSGRDAWKSGRTASDDGGRHDFSSVRKDIPSYGLTPLPSMSAVRNLGGDFVSPPLSLFGSPPIQGQNFPASAISAEVAAAASAAATVPSVSVGTSEPQQNNHGGGNRLTKTEARMIHSGYLSPSLSSLSSPSPFSNHFHNRGIDDRNASQSLFHHLESEVGVFRKSVDEVVSRVEGMDDASVFTNAIGEEKYELVQTLRDLKRSADVLIEAAARVARGGGEACVARGEKKDEEALSDYILRYRSSSSSSNDEDEDEDEDGSDDDNVYGDVLDDRDLLFEYYRGGEVESVPLSRLLSEELSDMSTSPEGCGGEDNEEDTSTVLARNRGNVRNNSDDAKDSRSGNLSNRFYRNGFGGDNYNVHNNDTPRRRGDGRGEERWRKYPPIPCTLGESFVAELCFLIDLDVGQHRLLADIMDAHWARGMDGT